MRSKCVIFPFLQVSHESAMMAKYKKISLIICTFFILNSSIHSEGELSAVIKAMNSYETFRANISINGILNGVVSYKRPNLLHVKFSDGRVIAANGRVLWVYSPSSAVAGKQDLRGSGGGISGLLSGYEEVSNSGKVIRLKSGTKSYEEIILTLGSNNLIRAIRMKHKSSGEYKDISFSGVQTNIGLASSLFNFHPPPNAQVVENPLNQRE